jgi:MraZ protein
VFVGPHEGRLDEKNRLAVPAKLRAEFGADTRVYLTPGRRNCIAAYSPEGFFEASDRVEAASNPDSDEGDDARDVFYGDAEWATFDAQGRIVISQRLLDYAHLEADRRPTDVRFVGMGKWFAIWDPQTYEESRRARAART